jgi:hypothetical protein
MTMMSNIWLHPGDLPERNGDSLGWSVGGDYVGLTNGIISQRPGLQPDNPTSARPGQRNLREGTIRTMDSNHNIGRLHNQHITRMPHTRWDSNLNKGIGCTTLTTGQQAQRHTTRLGCPLAGRRHNAAETTAHKQRTGTGNMPANFLGQCCRCRITHPGTADSDNRLAVFTIFYRWSQHQEIVALLARRGVQLLLYICLFGNPHISSAGNRAGAIIV